MISNAVKYTPPGGTITITIDGFPVIRKGMLHSNPVLPITE